MKSHSAIVIRDDKNNILFIKRSETKSTLPGAWSFPSGTQEEGESIEETTVRESKEELGVDVKIESTLAINELPEFKVRLHFIVCTISSGTPEIQEENEIAEIKWMSFKDFFSTFSDDEIGHGLIWLRKNPKVLAHFPAQYDQGKK